MIGLAEAVVESEEEDVGASGLALSFREEVGTGRMSLLSIPTNSWVVDDVVEVGCCGNVRLSDKHGANAAALCSVKAISNSGSAGRILFSLRIVLIVGASDSDSDSDTECIRD